MASGGYPGSFTKGHEITGVAEASSREGVTVFVAGAGRKDGAMVTSGGRVLAVTAHRAELPAAIKAAYDGVSDIDFQGKFFRTDIAAKAM
mmetsp:Transcript_55009/g.120632  ORF Transcript_55009/g.120632 Transcript_55009/m.120632 type:complete len:90 (+) Transcript_55009:990-1259(+)